MGQENGDKWAFVAALSALLSAMTRLSAAGVALPILIYCYISSGKKYRFLVSLALLLSLSIFSFMFFSNISGGIWGLLLHHTDQWGDITISEKIFTILFSRIPFILIAFAPFFFLLAILAAASLKKYGFGKIISVAKTYPGIITFFVGLGLFSILHLVTGTLYVEYFLPVFPSLFVLIAISLPKIRDQKLVEPAVNGVLLLIVFWYSYLFFWKPDFTGGKLPIAKVKEVAQYVQQNTSRTDTILSLEGAWIAIESNRSLLPGYSMAQFSYDPKLDSEEAKKIHLVNTEMILDDINHQRSVFVILSDLDWDTFQKNGVKTDISMALDNNYILKKKVADFGQYDNYLFIYMRR